MSAVQEAISLIQELKEDPGMNKRFKEKADSLIILLNEQTDLSLGKVMLALEELNSMELSSYHRTQVWDIISTVESIKNNF